MLEFDLLYFILSQIIYIMEIYHMNAIQTQRILTQSESQEVQQIAEFLDSIEYEYRDYMNGNIMVQVLDPLKTVKDINEIHIPVSDYIEVSFLQEDLQDLVITLKNTETKICIDLIKEDEQNAVSSIIAKNGTWLS